MYPDRIVGKMDHNQRILETKGFKKLHNPDPCITDEETYTVRWGLGFSVFVVPVSLLIRLMQSLS